MREPTNGSDMYAVTVRVCSIFLRRGGSIHCVVIGGRRYSADLPQGGLEIPCSLHFEGKLKEINKVKKHFKDESTATTSKCKVEAIALGGTLDARDPLASERPSLGDGESSLRA